MRKLFSRHKTDPTDLPAAASSGPPVEEGQHTGARAIADIDVMGSTAVATITVSELSLQNGAEQLADLLLELSETGAQHFVLDTQNVQYMDSACVGCLVEALNRLAAKGGKIALANADRNVQNLFRMTRLDRVFPICGDVMAAINAVERHSRPGGF
jgi:anti-sigma B factor antagonist